MASGLPTDRRTFPSLALAVGAAAITVANPYFVGPLRKFGRWLIGVAWLSALILAVAPRVRRCARWRSAGLRGRSSTWCSDPLMRRLHSPISKHRCDRSASTPRRRPSTARNGATLATARTPDGREVDVQVHGRDSWDSQFFVKFWRLVFYRSGGRNVTVNRRRQVEHQAYLTLFAEREGASVTPFVAAAIDQRGDAFFVSERVGPGFGPATTTISDDLLADAWRSLARLHHVGIRHGGITPDHLQVADGHVHFGDFDRATIDWADTSRQLDEAQL